MPPISKLKYQTTNQFKDYLKLETTQQFKKYRETEIARIKIENFESAFVGYVEHLALVEYCLETRNSPFVGDLECFNIERFNKELFQELRRVDAQWIVMRN
ncbi:MAG: hypothetical protein AAB340_01375 [Patescibacteria group bacterium]